MIEVADKFNMVDMGGIDVIESQGAAVEGLFNRLLNSIQQCRYSLLYNWRFADIEIVPTPVELVFDGEKVVINDLISIASDDVVHIASLENPPVIQSLSVDENGIYTPPGGVDGYSPVIVDVGSEPALPSEYQEVEYITFDGNEFMLVENLPSYYWIDVLASNSVSMDESTVVGYREASNNDRDFEIRFQNGSFNIWARSSTYTYTLFASNPAGSTTNVVRDIVVACVNHVRGKFLIGKYSTQNMDLPFFGNLYAIKLYAITRTQGALTVFDAIRRFVPCYRKSDGEIGVYEVYTSVFYPNEGAGTLIAGPDVN